MEIKINTPAEYSLKITELKEKYPDHSTYFWPIVLLGLPFEIIVGKHTLWSQCI